MKKPLNNNKAMEAKNYMEWPMGLFAGTGQAAEKEIMVQQTYNACLNYGKSKVAVRSWGDNAKAYEYLIENGWIEEWEEDGQRYCKLTEPAIATLKRKKHI